MNLLDPQALKAFLTIAEYGSFSAAADKLFITQPAISKRIALLEAQLESRLFDRINKKVFLTEAGKALLPHAVAVLQAHKEANQAVHNAKGSIAGTLSIAFSHHIGLHRLPPYLKRFNELYPQVNLNIQFIDSEQAYDKIINGQIELGVITLTPSSLRDIKTTPLWKDPLIFVCSQDHELHLRDDVTLNTLASLNAILPNENTYTGRMVAETFNKQNLTLNKSMSTNYLETIKMMVSIGLGWSILPKTMIENLERIHVPDTYIERTLGIIEHNGRDLSNAAFAFKELLVEE